jgi:transposase InsO family protein
MHARLITVVYLAMILDAFSRRVIGWALDRTMEDTQAAAKGSIWLVLSSPASIPTKYSSRTDVFTDAR